MSTQIGVLGAGSWGMALAGLLHQNGHNVTLWEYDAATCQDLSEKRTSPFMPDLKLSAAIQVTHELAQAAENKDFILIVLPSHTIRSVCQQLALMSLGNAILVSCSKGIENHSLKRVSEIMMENLPGISESQVAVLSGPSHAEEVVRQIPTAVTTASFRSRTARQVQEIMANTYFRVYTSQDLIGVELGGALKNVIAIAAGIIEGVGYGDNTKAALLTRGIFEMTRLGTAMDANANTFAGLSGIGDLIVTCTSPHSRNRYVGEEIGKGRKLKEILDEMIMVAEGVRTTQSAVDLSKVHHVNMPITQEVYQVLFEEKPPKEAIFDLMTRELKSED
ncbi:NAD(P)H-dependent glycerol-3-phosphate dehydrogenase [candidate division KSB1 bacterium]|nr:NAD(P)H-dependent glycerol-3-phosphate dehydrogenase [candidate division KSB1 bacterium]